MSNFYVFLIFSLSIVATVSAQINCQMLKNAFGVTRKFKSQNIDVNKINIHSYITDETYSIQSAARDIYASGTFDPDQDFYVWIHGWRSKLNTHNDITDALLKKGSKNVYGLDSSAYVSGINYVESSSYAAYIGDKLGDVLVELTKLVGLNNKKIHLIGHSLGAQIAAFAGKTYFETTGNKIGRISGLDPAGPCFASYPDDMKLTEDDAMFVDIIHTNVGLLGIDSLCGEVDFFVNGGSYQSGCNLNPTCNHGRAIEFFAESILEPQAFPAVKAQNWTDFRSKKANREMRYMGFGAKLGGSKGSYHLRTNAKSRYSMGMLGIESN